MVGPGLAGQIAVGGSFGGLLAFALTSALVPVLACLLRPRVLLATGGA